MLEALLVDLGRNSGLACNEAVLQGIELFVSLQTSKFATRSFHVDLPVFSFGQLHFLSVVGNAQLREQFLILAFGFGLEVLLLPPLDVSQELIV